MQSAGADLTNTCVKEHDLTGANFDGANATLMCMSFANFTNASFRGTELSGANLAGAKLDGADLTGAKTSITSFLGTDLTQVKGLTQTQLDVACGDAKTKLPPGLKIQPAASSYGAPAHAYALRPAATGPRAGTPKDH